MPEDFFLQFRQMAGMFLAEVIRSRRVSLRRAAEISHQVVIILPKISSEKDALALLTEVEKDFEEITVFKQALHFGYSDTDIRVYEREIKEYAAKIFTQDMPFSASFLQDASKQEMDIVKLCLKYPNFCEYLLKGPNKASLENKLQPILT
jgi:hypothetical protein